MRAASASTSQVARRTSRAGASENNAEIAGSWYVRLQGAGVGEVLPAYPEHLAQAADSEAPMLARLSEPVRFTDFRLRYRDAGALPSFEDDAQSDEEPSEDDGIVFNAADRMDARYAAYYAKAYRAGSKRAAPAPTV